MNDANWLQDFATRYATAWCSQDPEKVAAFYAKGASISVNGGGPTTHSGWAAASRRETVRRL